MTSSEAECANLVGGRLFPGEHARARFDVRETAQDLHVGFTGLDGTTRVSVDVRVAREFEGSELFADPGEASDFFRHGAAGFSATRGGDRLDGLELHTDAWRVEPLHVREVRSSFFDDEERFPGRQRGARLRAADARRSGDVEPAPTHEGRSAGLRGPPTRAGGPRRARRQDLLRNSLLPSHTIGS